MFGNNASVLRDFATLLFIVTACNPQKSIFKLNVGRCPTWWPASRIGLYVAPSVECCLPNRENNETKTRNPLKFAGVPQTRQPISAVSGPKFTVLWADVEDILLFNKQLFFRLSIHAVIPKIFLDKVVRWCAVSDSLRNFCVLYFQQAACSTFQTGILNSH